MNQLDALLNWAPEPYDQAKDSVVRIILRFLYQPSIQTKDIEKTDVIKGNS